MKMKRIALTGLLLAAASGLCAQDEGGGSWQHHNFAITLGAQSADYLDYQFTDWSGWGTRTEAKGGVVFELRYGLQFHKNWEWTIGTSGFANKVDFSSMNVYSSGWYSNGDDDVTASLLLTGVKAHWYPSGRGFNLYGGAEIGYGAVDGAFYDNDSGFAWALSGGAEFPVAEHFRIRLEAKHTAINVDEPQGYWWMSSGLPERDRPAYNSLAASFVFGWGD